MNKVQLIIGGARSGKSALAEGYAKSSNLPVTYIATAQAFDSEMQQRIAQHQADRPDHWQLIESPLLLAKTIELAIENSQQDICILVDCLTLWLSNSLCKPSDDIEHASECNLAYWQQEKQQLLHLLARIQQQNNFQSKNIAIILVSNEVGHGIVPMGELSRQFVDQAGWLHQAIASIADKVEFVMAGLPLTLKSSEQINTKAGL
jgi:adenosylcobinamide kinase/adenosylcobinamide-phosphate guanylyltransferase